MKKFYCELIYAVYFSTVPWWLSNAIHFIVVSFYSQFFRSQAMFKLLKLSDWCWLISFHFLTPRCVNLFGKYINFEMCARYYLVEVSIFFEFCPFFYFFLLCLFFAHFCIKIESISFILIDVSLQSLR